MDALVGYTGFVGSNIASQHSFDMLFNSKNINESFGLNPDMLVFSAVPAEMFLANSNPEKDFAVIEEAIENVKKINPKQLVLISTIAVYDRTDNVNEDTVINTDALTPYGKHRLFLEEKLAELFEKHLIVRLPAIYGINLKKNFLYDYIHVIPKMLKAEKFMELNTKNAILKKYYKSADNGFFVCQEMSKTEKENLKGVFRELNFSALNFTDSRSRYQFYSLFNLWDAIQKCLDAKVKKINLVTPPISTAELYSELSHKTFKNEISAKPFNYNIKTTHTQLFGLNSGYVQTRDEELREIKKFVQSSGGFVWN